MCLPSSAEITQLRADLEAVALPDTCTILTVVKTSDGEGGYTYTNGTAAAGVACRMDIMSEGEEMMGGEAIRPYETYMLTVPYSTTLTEAHQISFNSNLYNVVSVADDHSWQVNKRAVLERTT